MSRVDVAILGAGLAGLSLARHLLLDTDCTVTLLDPLDVPGPHMKVGESTVQVGAFYYARVLQMEETLMLDHFLKYNLRFYWKTPGRSDAQFQEYSQTYLRKMSDIACYQLDRAAFEAALLREVSASPRCTVRTRVRRLDVALGDLHRVTYQLDGEEHAIDADWVVDASGLGMVLRKKLGLEARGRIRHGATWCWVDGLVDPEALTDLAPSARRAHAVRRQQGHFPVWLSTNHFCGEGFWFWVIPLRRRTSLGIVYDRAVFPEHRVQSAADMIDWACEEFPLFQRDLPARKVIDWGRIPDYAHDCQQVVGERWAITGIAGRFLDPLYSPGSDFIAYSNSLIVDAVQNGPSPHHDRMMRALYRAFVPSYEYGYTALGDQEAFSLKYAWELSVYFSFMVMPFINGVMTDRSFQPRYLALLGKLGPINHDLHKFIADFARWKMAGNGAAADLQPKHVELFSFEPLQRAERMFYETGRSADEIVALLERQVDDLLGFARHIVAQVRSAVSGTAVSAESVDLHDVRFDSLKVTA